MALFLRTKEFSTNSSTSIDNVFLTEYMPELPSSASVVYLYGLLLSGNSEFDLTLSAFSKDLKLSEEEVVENFKTLSDFGLIRLTENPFSVTYLPILRGIKKPRKINGEKYGEFAVSVQELLPSRMISTNEFTEYYDVMDVYNIKPEAMLMIIKYCVDLKGNDIGYRYISSVAKNFGSKGINTVEKVEDELSSYVIRTSEITEILNALNSKRKPEIEDMELLDKWTKELGFDFENVLFAAKKLKKSSIKKLDEFIMELYSFKWFDKDMIEKYAKEKKALIDLTVKINRALSVYYEVLDTVVTNYTSKWVNLGFDEDALLLIANYCFTHSKNSLEAMNAEIENLYKKGVISVDSLKEYFKQRAESDEFLKQILDITGSTRKVTDWDRENLSQWQSWNFTYEMIKEAALRSIGKANPLAYMNAILGAWKNQNTYNAEDIKTDTKDEQADEFTLYRNLDKALLNDDFKKVYYEIKELQKDLAFAQFSDDDKKLSAINEKLELLIKERDKIIANIGFKLQDLPL